jgi:hypothetical protein
MVAHLTQLALAISLIISSYTLAVAASPEISTPSPEKSTTDAEPGLENVLLANFDETYSDSCGSDCAPVYDPDDIGIGEVVTSTLLLDAWIEQGFTWNPDSPANRFNVPVTFNDRSNEYQLNQLYLSLGRGINSSGQQWDFGGQIDLLYGTDYFFTESNGLERRRNGTPHWNSPEGPRGTGAALYGLAMPQLYAEVFAPWGNGLTVRFGHFYTILGCESVRAPDNFFYSHTYVMQFGEPKTHTGMLAAYNITPRITLQAGLTRGWDAWDGPNDKAKLLAGLSWTSCDKRNVLALAVHAGSEDAAGLYNRTSYSLVWSRLLTKRLTYVLQHDLGIEQHVEVNKQGNFSDAKWYGLNQYLIYDLNCTTSLGLRFEWFRDQDNARVISFPDESVVEGGNYWAVTLGLNWKPTERITVRPECRWDWSDVSIPSAGFNGMYDDFSDKNQFTLGTDVIFRY